MFKNRSVKTNFGLTSLLLLNNQISEEDKREPTDVEFCGDGCLTEKRNLSSSCDAESFGKSSSSSASWIEEDAEATNKVQCELLRMQRILMGMEKIPPHYDQGEYELWMKTFPTLNLSITGKKLEVAPNVRSKQIHCDYEETIAVDPLPASDGRETCNTDPTSKEIQQIKTNLKRAVIEKIFTDVSSRLFRQEANNTRRKKVDLKVVREITAQKETNNDKLLTDLSNVLRISPVPLLKNSSESSLVNRENSSLPRHFVASKWLQDESPEYMSLPHLLQQDITLSRNRVLGSAKPQAESQVANGSRTGISVSGVHYVTLPPIETTREIAVGPFRSISATPRCRSKSTSEIGVCAHSPKHQSRKLKKTNRKIVDIQPDVVL